MLTSIRTVSRRNSLEAFFCHEKLDKPIDIRGVPIKLEMTHQSRRVMCESLLFSYLYFVSREHVGFLKYFLRFLPWPEFGHLDAALLLLAVISLVLLCSCPVITLPKGTKVSSKMLVLFLQVINYGTQVAILSD